MNNLEFGLMVFGIIALPCLCMALNRVQFYKRALSDVIFELENLHAASTSTEIKLAVVETYETAHMACRYRLARYSGGYFASKRKQAYQSTRQYQAYLTRREDLKATIVQECELLTPTQKNERNFEISHGRRWFGLMSALRWQDENSHR